VREGAREGHCYCPNKPPEQRSGAREGGCLRALGMALLAAGPIRRAHSSSPRSSVLLASKQVHSGEALPQRGRAGLLKNGEESVREG